MNNTLLTRSLLIGSLCGFVGCDYLPETITGRPNPNAPRIEAVGPTGTSAAQEAMATNQIGIRRLILRYPGVHCIVNCNAGAVVQLVACE